MLGCDQMQAYGQGTVNFMTALAYPAGERAAARSGLARPARRTRRGRRRHRRAVTGEPGPGLSGPRYQLRHLPAAAHLPGHPRRHDLVDQLGPVQRRQLRPHRTSASEHPALEGGTECAKARPDRRRHARGHGRPGARAADDGGIRGGLQRPGLERHDGVRRRVGGRLQRTAVHRELVEPGPPAQPVLRPVPGVAGRRGLHRRHHPATAATAARTTATAAPAARATCNFPAGRAAPTPRARGSATTAPRTRRSRPTPHMWAPTGTRPRRRPCGGG